MADTGDNASDQPGAATQQRADLVLEGGGVRGIALASAVATLAREGYHFQRIAGTSAGAIVGSVLAALIQAGESPSRLVDIAASLDYTRFQDRGRLGRLAETLGLGALATPVAVALHSGIYRGRYLRDWLVGVLADLGVRTFGDLRLPDDPGSDLPEEHRYRLVVIVSDVTRRRMVRLPWDYGDYRLDPDEQPVADAVRASASIPFYFRPAKVRLGDRGAVSLVDGGMLSNYPITLFDRTDGTQPRWPTFGIDLVPQEKAKPISPVSGPVSLAFAVVETMMGAHDALQIAEPCNAARSVRVEVGTISGTDFGQAKQNEPRLLEAGERGARKFLQTWDFADWLRTCRGGAR